MDGFGEVEKSGGLSPLGIAITGQAGTGKTHLLSWVRTQVQAREGYFFLVSLLHGRDFWQNVVHALLSGLHRPAHDGRQLQLMVVVERLADRSGVSQQARRAVIGGPTPSRAAVDEFVSALRRTDRRLGRECKHTVRAMLLLATDDSEAQDIGENYLTFVGEATRSTR